MQTVKSVNKPTSFNCIISLWSGWVRENIQCFQHLNLMKMTRIKIREVTTPGQHAAGEHHGQTDRCPLCFWKASWPDRQADSIFFGEHHGQRDRQPLYFQRTSWPERLPTLFSTTSISGNFSEVVRAGKESAASIHRSKDDHSLSWGSAV